MNPGLYLLAAFVPGIICATRLGAWLAVATFDHHHANSGIIHHLVATAWEQVAYASIGLLFFLAAFGLVLYAMGTYWKARAALARAKGDA